MITVMFRCVGKSSKINDDNITMWTITLERSDLTLKVKTCARQAADNLVEGKMYPIDIKEDHELGGLFTPNGESIDRETGEIEEPGNVRQIRR